MPLWSTNMRGTQLVSKLCRSHAKLDPKETRTKQTLFISKFNLNYSLSFLRIERVDFGSSKKCQQQYLVITFLRNLKLSCPVLNFNCSKNGILNHFWGTQITSLKLSQYFFITFLSRGVIFASWQLCIFKPFNNPQANEKYQFFPKKPSKSVKRSRCTLSSRAYLLTSLN